ncbi:MAG: ABC transporter substrate-binding protein [Chloroflexi bacterium]|nr:ABC transporter substrate-binding protein [Chloroflexota bacterium]
MQAATISSAFLRLVGDAPNVIAQQRGYFKEVGIDFTLVPFDGGSKAMPSLSTGQIDILPATADVNFFNAVARGIQLRIGADDSTLAPGHDIYGMAVRKELVDSGRYKSPKDFKGMKVAVSSLTGSLYYIVALLAQKNGFTLKDMDISALAFADALVALKQGGIDAANLVEPFTSRSETEGFAKVTLRSLDISPDIPGAHLMMSPQFVQKGDVAVRFYTAWLRGLRDYLTEFVNGKNSDQMVKLLQANQIAIVPTAQNPTFDPDGKVPVKPVKDLFQFFKDLGQIQGNVDPDSTFDQSFVTKAAQQLGPYKP